MWKSLKSISLPAKNRIELKLEWKTVTYGKHQRQDCQDANDDTYTPGRKHNHRPVAAQGSWGIREAVVSSIPWCPGSANTGSLEICASHAWVCFRGFGRYRWLPSPSVSHSLRERELENQEFVFLTTFQVILIMLVMNCSLKVAAFKERLRASMSSQFKVRCTRKEATMSEWKAVTNWSTWYIGIVRCKI